MTPAERALLLAVASSLRGGRHYDLEHWLDKYIRAVQAEAAPEAPAEARDEGFTATAVCYPITQEIKQ